MSCLFNSMSYFLPYSSNEIRQQICNYLEENKPIMESMETKQILAMEKPNYIASMRQSSTWGGAIEIQAACNIWNLKIMVKNIRNNPVSNIEFIPLHKNPARTIHISWNGGHYEPIHH
jgi:uncharacterized protein YpbB